MFPRLFTNECSQFYINFQGNSISRFLLGHLSDVDSSLISSEVLLGGCCIVVSASMGVLLAAQPAAASYPTSLCLSAFLAGFAFGSPWTLVPRNLCNLNKS